MALVKEQFLEEDYLITTEPQSQIDPLRTITVEIGMTCPKCRRQMPKLANMQIIVCECGLRVRKCWDIITCEIDDKAL